MKKYLIPLLCAGLLSLVSQAVAAVGKKVSFPSFDTGHIYGETISQSDLRGKVVFFEHWGIGCGPCIAAMPHLVEMQKKYGDKGFTVIGSHVQELSPEVKAFLQEKKVNFPVYQQKRLPEAPIPGGIPFAVLIGADGRIVAQGSPFDMYNLVEDELAKVGKGYPILCDVELDKYKSLEKTVVSTGSNIEAKVEELRGAAEGGDAEAKAVCDAFDAWLTDEKQSITRQFDTNPLKAMKSVSQLKKAVPSVTDFDEQVQATREKPAFQKLAAVQKKLDGIQKRQAKGKAVPAGTVKSLKKAVAEIREMDEPGVASPCEAIEAELDALTSSSDTDKGDKKDKKEKKEKKEKKGRKGSSSHMNSNHP